MTDPSSNDPPLDFLAWQQRLRDEKLESLKRLAYGASHEINNPLANIASRAQALLTDEDDPERRHELATIYAQAMRAHEMIADLMLFARPPQPHLAQCELGAIVQEVVEQLQALAEQQETQLRFSPPNTEISLLADSNQLAVAIQALVRNSLEAVRSGGSIEISISHAPPYAMVRVADDGPGIPHEMAETVFDPFYSGREAGRGLGFGLTKCWTIARAHAGEVYVDQNVQNGTQMVFKIPLAYPPS